MEETHATTPESSPATDIPARTIEPSKILTPPDMDYFNTYRVDQKEVLPHQSPPVPHRAVINPVNARRMRSVSASAAFDAPIKTPPLHPLLSPGPVPHHPHMIQPQGTPTGIVTREQALMAGEKETDGLRSPRGTRKAPLPADGSSVPPQSPLSPRGETIPTEIPGSPKRKRHTVSVGDGASAANAANGKKRRQRQKKTPTQVAVLERHFVINPHPDKQTRDTLALQLGFTSRQVQIWFQNARAKAKQNARKNGIEMTNAPTMANGTVMPPLNGHKHPQLSMNPTNGIHPHPQQTQHQPIAPAGPITNGGGGRKIFSPPSFNPADLDPLSSPQSPISPYLSSLALSPRFPTRTIHPHPPQHNPMVYNSTVNSNNGHNNLHHSSPENSNTVLEGVNSTNNMLSPPALTMADVASLTGVVSMEEVPCTPPVTNMLSQPVSPAQASSVYNEVQQHLTVQTAAETLQQQTATDVPLSPPPPSSPLEDFPQLSMSAPSPFSVLQKQMLLEDQGHSMAGVTTAGGDADSYEDPFALPSSPPLPSSFGPPLVPLLPQAVFFSEQNQKAALAHLEHNDVGLSRQQQQMFQHHTLLTQQHFMQQQSLNNQQQQQHALAVATQAASISSEMDFFFYEAPSKNLVQFGDADGDGDFFWGGVDSLNP